MENLAFDVRETKRMQRAGAESDVTLLGAFPHDCTVIFELSFPRSLAADGVKMAFCGDPLEGSAGTREIPGTFSRLELDRIVFSFAVETERLARETTGGKTGLLYYHYEIATEDGVILLGGEEREPTLLDFADGAGRQLLVYDASFETPAPFKGGLIYQIFPDRFRRSGRVPPGDRKIDPDWYGGVPRYGEYPGAPVANDVFFGGDLYGIMEKLPYIKSLGVTAIYLNPVFSSPSNHRYDTADYLKVDDLLGGDGALEQLITNAEKLGIGIILDGVFAHTGADSVYFNKFHNYPPVGACDDAQSPYFDWYTFEKYPDKYACWWGVDILPKVNTDSPSFKGFILGPFLDKWMNTGVSGWRLDVADEVTDSFLEEFRLRVKEYGDDKLLIGEVWEDASCKVSYGKRRRYLRGSSLDSVMNYPLRQGLTDYMLRGDAPSLRRVTETLYRHYPKPAADVMMNVLSTHDTVRIITELGDMGYDGLPNSELAARRLTKSERKVASRRLIALYGALAALPGIPSVFYGDEAGLEGYRDPFCRMPFPWGREDGVILSEFRRIGEFRKNEPLLKEGLFEIIYLDPEVFIFARRPWNGEADYSLVVALNRTEEEREVSLPFDVTPYEGGDTTRRVVLPPVNCAYFKTFTSRLS